MGADFQDLFFVAVQAFGSFVLGAGATSGFLLGLHPKCFGDMGNGFRESVQGCGSGVEACRERLPPGIEQRVDGVG
jgi:hypothetical protein